MTALHVPNISFCKMARRWPAGTKHFVITQEYIINNIVVCDGK